jgi:hypothetical protein
MSFTDCCQSATPPAQVPGPSGANAWAVVTASFNVPAIGSTVTVTVNQTAGFVVGQNVYVATASAAGGNFTVYSVNSPTSITLTFLGFSGDFAAASTVAANSLMVPGTGNLYTITTAPMTTIASTPSIPSPGQNVTVTVFSTAGFFAGMNCVAQLTGGGIANFLVASIGSTTSMTLTFLDFPGDGTTTFQSNGAIIGGAGNQSTFGAATTTKGAFQIPAYKQNAPVTIGVVNASNFITGQNVFIGGGGYFANFVISAISLTAGNNTLTLLACGFPSDSPVGDSIPSGAIVTPGVSGMYGYGILPCPSGGITGYDGIGAGLANYQSNVGGAGTDYTMTSAYAIVTINSNPVQVSVPILVYALVFARIRVDMLAAKWTSDTTYNIYAKIRNANTGTDVANSVTQFAFSATETAQTGTVATIALPPVPVILSGTTATPIVLQLQAYVDTPPNASSSPGSMAAVEASIVLSPVF